MIPADDASIIGLRDEMDLVIHQIQHLQRSQNEIIAYLVEESSDIVLKEVIYQLQKQSFVDVKSWISFSFSLEKQALAENYEVITQKIHKARMMREVLLQKDVTYRPTDDAVAFEGFLAWERLRELQERTEQPQPEPSSEIAIVPIRTSTAVSTEGVIETNADSDSIPPEGLFL